MMSSSASTTSPVTESLATRSLQDFCTSLSSKQPTPGGGASAAVGAAVGACASAMAGAYTQRKKDEESGAAEHARAMIARMDVPSLLAMADDDVNAYKALQATWKKDCDLTAEEVRDIQATALRVPTVLVEACHARILAIQEFLPHCNPGITSDAKVGVHQLAGAARAAFQTVLVNTPPDDERQRLLNLLREIQEIENGLLGL
jgi:formiminotetrahydrofolate cyclodeaminase